MKNLIFVLCVLFSLQSFLFGQTAEGGCSQVTLLTVPLYPKVWIASAVDDCGKDPCFNKEEECCAIGIWKIRPMPPKLFLQKKNNFGNWVTVSGPKYGFPPYIFENVNEKGMYRIKIITPYYDENSCCIDFHGNITKKRIKLFNGNGQFIGYWGTYNNTPFGGNKTFFTNEVIVGHTTLADNSFTFIDEPETGSEHAYDEGETVIMDASASNNYNLWYLSIGESGPVYNRWKSNEWTNGTIDIFDLTAFWNKNTSWNFEVFHSYDVNFVVENHQCRNGIEYPGTLWNIRTKTFFVCPAGSGCRIVIDEHQFSILPNPANNTIFFKDFDPVVDKGYRISLYDMAGRLVKSESLNAEYMDISDLTNGMYVIALMKNGKKVFKAKLQVIH